MERKTDPIALAASASEHANASGWISELSGRGRGAGRKVRAEGVMKLVDRKDAVAVVALSHRWMESDGEGCGTVLRKFEEC